MFHAMGFAIRIGFFIDCLLPLFLYNNATKKGDLMYCQICLWDAWFWTAQTVCADFSWDDDEEEREYGHKK